MVDERDGTAPPDARDERLRAGADQLRDRRGRVSPLDRPNLLMGVAAAMMTTGLSLVVLGWAGAARSIRVEEQVPYLISGGLLGLALAIIGALVLFTHWLTVLIREGRERDRRRDEQHAELIAALEELRWARSVSAGNGGEVAHGDPRGPRTQRPLRAAPSGS